MNSEQDNEMVLASRWDRLWASLIDSLIGFLLGLPLMLYFDIFTIVKETGTAPLIPTLITAVVSWLLFFLLNGALLKKYGQTIGKKAFGISIVSDNGTILTLPAVILKRFLPVVLASHIPVVGRLLVLLDPLFIFKKDKKCLHDHIAGTKVINFNANNPLKGDREKAAAL